MAFSSKTPAAEGGLSDIESLNLKLHPVDVDDHGLQSTQLAINRRANPPTSCAVISSHGGNCFRWSGEWPCCNGRNVPAPISSRMITITKFHYDGSPLPALKAMSAENVIYLGTFSKSLGAGLRTGYAIFPDHLSECRFCRQSPARQWPGLAGASCIGRISAQWRFHPASAPRATELSAPPQHARLRIAQTIRLRGAARPGCRHASGMEADGWMATGA